VASATTILTMTFMEPPKGYLLETPRLLLPPLATRQPP
jgi:hypothetical protein